jgi:hypothetical protein
VIQDELAASLEQIQKTRRAAFAFEDVVLLNSDHGQATALSSKCVVHASGSLLLNEQLFAGHLPLRE